jgi:hypothetical protein
MDHTHIFEIDIEQVKIHGTMCFNSGGACAVKPDSTKLPLQTFKRIVAFLEQINKLYSEYGEITKIEVARKPE